MIYRGTTPTHIFSCPFEQQEISRIYITYMQQNQIKVEKVLNDITFNNDGTMEVSLTQMDTLLFNRYTPDDRTADSMVLIQIRARLTNGEVWASEIIRERIGDILKDGQI